MSAEPRSFAALVRHRREMRGGGMVQQVCEGEVALGLLYVGVGGAVHDDVDILGAADDAYRIGIGYIEVDRLHIRCLRDVGENETVSAPAGSVAYLPAQLTVGASNQYIHVQTVKMLLNASAASFFRTLSSSWCLMARTR